MIKKAIALILAAAVLLALPACQATPDEAFVVQKDTERMVSQAADDSTGTKVSELNVPEGNYTFTASAADGKLTITVDAPVTVPGSEKIPTARVSETGFTQEQVTGFFNYLFPDEKPILEDDGRDVMTKEEIKELILQYKQYIANGTTEDKMYTEEEMKEEIESLEKQYETAPETESVFNAKISDGTMIKAMIPTGDADEEVWMLKAGTKDKGITILQSVDENGSWGDSFVFSRRDNTGYSEINAVKIHQSTVMNDELTDTYEAAKKLCDGFFKAGSITDVVLSDAYILDAGIYKFEYVRTVNNYPVSYMECGTGISRPENALPWFYEHIMFWVSDRGIEYINWLAHTATGEIINEDTGVIGFEEACEIFKTMAVTIYGTDESWSEDLSAVSIEVSEIALSLVRVREQNAPGRNGIYTPAWLFYGNIKNEYGAYDFVQYGWDLVSEYPFTKYPVLIINAVDGSIIDSSKGY